jgi:hypothetical protein
MNAAPDQIVLSPHNEEAEAALLSVLLQGDGAPLLDEIPWLTPTDFFLTKNQWVFEAIRKLKERREYIDFITVRAELNALKYLDQMPDPNYASVLYANFPQGLPSYRYQEAVYTYARTIQEHARQRKVLKLNRQLAQAAFDGDAERRDSLVAELVKLQVASADQNASKRLQLTPARALYDLPPQEWLIPGLLLAKGLNVLYGPSGSGKSFVALDWSLQTAQTGSVVYIAAEGFGGYPDRVKAWCNHHKKAEDGLYFVDRAVNLLDWLAVSTFVTLVKSLQPKLVVIDTLSRCMTGGDENSAKDMSQVVAACAEIQQQANTAILLVHHTPRTEHGGPRGSNSLDGAADSMVAISESDGLITISGSKAKDDAKPETQHYRLMETDARPGRRSCVIMPTDQIIQTSGDKLTEKQRAILTVLDGAGEAGASYSDIRSGTGSPKQTIVDSLTKLKRLGFAMQSKEREPWHITESGRQKLGTVGTDVSRPYRDVPDNVGRYRYGGSLDPVPVPTSHTTPQSDLWHEKDRSIAEAGNDSVDKWNGHSTSPCPLCNEPRQLTADGNHYCVNPECSIGQKHVQEVA